MTTRVVDGEVQVYVRVCQACSNAQEGKEPNRDKELPDTWLNAKCKKCKSEALDFGSWKTGLWLAEYNLD